MPLISVIIPTYNRGSKIQKTLDSVLAQAYSEIEILVIDDGSTDGTPDWVESFYGEKIRVLRQHNQGVAAARNRGLEAAKGEYLAFLDHDDIWLPEKLQLQWEQAKQHPEAALISCLWGDIDENENEWKDDTWQQLFRNWKPARGHVYDWICASPCPIVSMTLPLIRKDALQKIGGFDSKLVPCDDWDVYLKLAHSFPFEMVEEKLALYVHHNKQQSGNQQRTHAATLRVLKNQFPAIIFHPRSWLFWWNFTRFLPTSEAYTFAKSALENGQRKSVAHQFFRLLFVNPSALLTRQWIYLGLRSLRGQKSQF